jgi:hypothetical protein
MSRKPVKFEEQWIPSRDYMKWCRISYDDRTVEDYIGGFMEILPYKIKKLLWALCHKRKST